jgi:hypothetical protein
MSCSVTNGHRENCCSRRPRRPAVRAAPGLLTSRAGRLRTGRRPAPPVAAAARLPWAGGASRAAPGDQQGRPPGTGRLAASRPPDPFTDPHDERGIRP